MLLDGKLMEAKTRRTTCKAGSVPIGHAIVTRRLKYCEVRVTWTAGRKEHRMEDNMGGQLWPVPEEVPAPRRYP